MTLAPARDERKPGFPAHLGGRPIAWRVEAGPVSYEHALAVMAARAAAVAESTADELAWLQRHGLVPVRALDTIVLVFERDAVRVGRDQAAVGEGDVAGVLP